MYDDLGQLIREDNGLRNTTYCYTYDDAGNIIAKTTHPLTAQGVTPTSTQNTDSYTYSSSAWGDLLTSFDGREITYDEIGNPLTYNNGVGYTFTWSGRQMTGLRKGNVTYSFTYNDEGIRTTKTKAGVTTTYYLSGSQIIGEETNGNITLYVYDSDGSPLGMQYHAASYAADVWDVYWFEKNLLGDVVALYDEAGTKLITYTYDAYGRCLRNQYNGGYSTTAMNNPFRYRGYYYDSDLELYYLNSRYYDAYTGRFISPDSAEYLGANGDLNSYNLYAYCSNNPVALSYVCFGNSRNIGFTSCSVTINAFAVTSSQISSVNHGLNFDFIVNGVSTISTIHGWYQATSKLVNHVNYFYNNIEPFKSDMKVIGISTTKGVLAFNNFTWKLGKSDAFSVLLGVGFDVYDSIQNGASSGEMLLSASLTAVKGVGMIYLNKVIVYGATTVGSAICPGAGTAIGFVVGEVIYIIVDIAASNLLDELIDEIVN